MREAGVLGVNARNASYLLPNNARARQATVNCKLTTKAMAGEYGIAVPELYGTVHFNGQIRATRRMLNDYSQFAVKPAHGAGGDGILVVTGCTNGRWRQSGGIALEPGDLDFHLSNILSGMYSLGGHPDAGFVEALVRFDPVFDELTWGGVPDVRMLVYKGVPAMAMVRLPTQASDGKANLHKGGLGVGVDISTGVTETAVCNDRAVEEHPDTGADVAGIEVPGWAQMLDIAARCRDMTGLDFLGVDMVLDRDRGPLLLELNARPGLAIQIANAKGLRHRLDRIDEVADGFENSAQRIAFAREQLGQGVAPIRRVA
jgi:alpha-L-glutamate ligase-like protein